MCMTIRRFIAVYSPATASAETRQQQSLFVPPEQEYGELISQETFLYQLARAKRHCPRGFCLAYLRYVHTRQRYFLTLMVWLRQQMAHAPFTRQQQTAVALTCLYLLLCQKHKVTYRQALHVYRFGTISAEQLQMSEHWVNQLYYRLEQELAQFIQLLETQPTEAE
ncbi:hypothetical protein CSW98_08730 [Vibrio sp. HA2012]|uniref:hypothetical protein n=1 Tax=Vibrio sp. HA2012 TaxID=1971595 RepID=UPI000C2C7D9F|nr:hypothetical protein [Vibrio sp. HA2012]PJC86293.1 hypothetical protein CSW98_08730 [Vibrio sp. HA2012]